MRASLQRTSVLAAALLVLGVAAAFPGRVPLRADDPRPNVIVILTDDQSFDTLPSEPAAMPWLQARLTDPSDHWRWFPNAYLNTPLCCPSRASILTGLYSHHTGVQDNGEGHLLDERTTLAVRLHDAGYRTGLIGKYLNRYPFGRGPYVPAGWDRWVGKQNLSDATTYYGYPFVDQGVPLTAGLAPQDYATDLLAREAVGFVRSAPAAQPFFLLFAPSAPHDPQTPPPRYASAFAGLRLPRPPSFGRADPGKPPWIRALPPISEAAAQALDDARLRERQTLLAVDDAVQQIVAAVAARGDLERTVIFFLTDNGLAFGEHGWTAKSCPYVECVRTPFAVSLPGAAAGSDPTLVSNVDLAPTIAGLAGLEPRPSDGLDLTPLLEGTGPAPPRAGVLTEYHGDANVPAWQGVRTPDFAYIRTGTFEELYDLSGALGPADPFEMHDRIDDPAYLDVRLRLAALTTTLASADPGDG
ncbi:MAG: sulfatase [Actinomycetota bacterium]